MRKVIVPFLFLLCINLSCERDDICAETTSTTPRLIVEFYDATDQEELKSVPRLTVYGEGLIVDSNNNPTQPETSSDKTLVFNQNVNSVELPLIIENENVEVISRFILEKDTNLRLDEDNPSTSNIDIIEISYEPRFEYVSRACGYKSTFELFSVTIDPNDTDNWISSIQIDPDIEIIENENTVHVRIFH